MIVRISGEGQFSIEQGALGGQHIEIAGPSALVAQIGQMQGGSQRLNLLLLRLALLAGFLNGDQRVFHFLKRL